MHRQNRERLNPELRSVFLLDAATRRENKTHTTFQPRQTAHLPPQKNAANKKTFSNRPLDPTAANSIDIAQPEPKRRRRRRPHHPFKQQCLRLQ